MPSTFRSCLPLTLSLSSSRPFPTPPSPSLTDQAAQRTGLATHPGPLRPEGLPSCSSQSPLSALVVCCSFQPPTPFSHTSHPGESSALVPASHRLLRPTPDVSHAPPLQRPCLEGLAPLLAGFPEPASPPPRSTRTPHSSRLPARRLAADPCVWAPLALRPKPRGRPPTGTNTSIPHPHPPTLAPDRWAGAVTRAPCARAGRGLCCQPARVSLRGGRSSRPCPGPPSEGSKLSCPRGGASLHDKEPEADDQAGGAPVGEDGWKRGWRSGQTDGPAGTEWNA